MGTRAFGLTACAALKDARMVPPRDIRVMGIRAEESAWFGVSYIGSRSTLGVLPEGALDTARRIDTGRTLAEHMAEAGAEPDRLRAGEVYAPPESIHAYLEVHIEQGPVLEEAGLPVGVVTGIRGNRRLPQARCLGEYSHCGGMPRSHRRDTVVAAAELVGELDKVWAECEAGGQDFAFTVGKFFTDGEWHAMTKIAGEVSDWDASSWMSPKEQRRNDRFIQLAVGAAQMAMDHAGYEIPDAEAHRVGVIVGAGLGGLRSIEDTHTILQARGPKKISPF